MVDVCGRPRIGYARCSTTPNRPVICPTRLETGSGKVPCRMSRFCQCTNHLTVVSGGGAGQPKVGGAAKQPGYTAAVEEVEFHGRLPPALPASAPRMVAPVVGAGGRVVTWDNFARRRHHAS